MSFLRALMSLFRRSPARGDAYDDEVLFSGWVDLPPLVRSGEATAPRGREVTSA